MGQTGGTRHFFYLTLAEQQEQTKLGLITLFISIACTGLGKIAIGITILKIVGNTSKWQKWSVWFTMGVTAATSIIDMLLIMFRCGDPSQLWDFARLIAATASNKCINAENVDGFNLFSAAWQAFADFFFSLLPMAIVWQLKLPSRKKLYLICALGLTLITGVVGIIKTVLVSQVSTSDPTTDPTWKAFSVIISFGTEGMLIIVCGSVPALRPLWERLFNRAAWRSRQEMYGGSGFKGSSYGPGGSSKGTMESSGRYPFHAPTSQNYHQGRFQADEDSTKKVNVTLMTESDVELNQISGYSIPQAPAAVFTDRAGNSILYQGQGSSESWFHSMSTTRDSDEERGLGRIHVKREVIVSDTY